MARRRTQVGIRELKARLSSYLRRVRAGETLAVTDRGAVVAELRPPPARGGPSAEYRKLAAEGRLVPAKEPRNLEWLGLARRLPRHRAGSIQRLLRQDRQDRF